MPTNIPNLKELIGTIPVDGPRVSNESKITIYCSGKETAFDLQIYVYVNHKNIDSSFILGMHDADELVKILAKLRGYTISR